MSARKEDPSEGNAGSKRTWEEFHRMIIQARTSAEPTESAAPDAGSKRPARASFEQQEGGSKKTRPALPETSAATSENDIAASVENVHARSAGTDPITAENDMESDESEEPMPVAWEEELVRYRQRMEESLAPTEDVQRLADLTKQYCLGGAYVHTFGVGHVRSVVNLGEDPNLRGNPRQLNPSHVDNLFSVFSVADSRRDHESPIYLMVDPSRIDPEVLQAMSKVSARNAAAVVPRLVLRHDYTSEVWQLEEQLLSQVKDKRWMSEEELQQAATRLKELRAQIPLATLLNGRHRIEALSRVGSMVQEDHYRLLQDVRQNTISQEDMRAEMSDIQHRSKMTVYRVEVYDSAMPDILLNHLVRNEDQRPQMGMGPGEKAWWTASRWETLMSRAHEEGEETRAAAANKAFISWCRDIGVNVARAVAGAQAAPQAAQASPQAGPQAGLQASSGGRKAPKRDTHGKGDWAGTDAVTRLFTDPCTMEAVLDTRSAMTVYNNVLRRPIAVAMLQWTGALLVGRFWLACRTFLQIFNVSKGRGFESAGQYVDATPQITPDGDRGAIVHWNALHSHPQNIPEYTPFYDDALQSEFDQLYSSALGSQELSLDIPWTGIETYQRVRGVFDTLGKRLQGRQLEWCRKVGLSMRIYARLPAGTGPDLSRGPHFFATSALPAKRWLERLSVERQHFNLDSHGLVVLEMLLEKHLPIWTVGAQSIGTSANCHNWYGCSRGLHQILMRYTRADGIGSMDARLNCAIVVLSDPLLRRALRHVDNSLNTQFQRLMRDCCVLRSHPLDYPFLERLPPENIQAAGGRRALLTQISQARSSLKQLIFGSSSHPTAEEYDRLLRRSYPAFWKLIPPSYWREFDPAWWVLGWNTNRAKRFRDVNAMVGWGFLMSHVETLLSDVMREDVARHLMVVGRQIAQEAGIAVWWEELLPCAVQGSPHQDDVEMTGSDSPAPAQPSGDQTGDDEDEESVQRSEHSRERRSGDMEVLEEEEYDEDRSGDEKDELEGDEDELGSERDELEDEEEQAERDKDVEGDGRDLGMHSGEVRGRESPDPPESEDGHCFASASVNLSRVGVNETMSSTGIHAGTGQAQLGSQSGSSGGTEVWQLVLQRNPVHLMTPPIAPSTTLDYLIGCDLNEHHEQPELIREAIERNANGLESVMLRISSERQKLRQSVAVAARHCIDADYGGYFTLVGLAPMMAAYKDIYVTCVARILREELDLSETEAVNEAMSMAMSDDLYKFDIANFNSEEGKLKIDVAQTMARGQQYQLQDGEYIEIGTVKGAQKERDEVFELIQWFHPVRGVGRTEAESTERGMEGAILQLTKRKQAGDAPPTFLSMTTNPPILPAPETAHTSVETPFIEDVHKKWGIAPWIPPQPCLTRQSRVSPLSTGRFFDSSSNQVPVPRELEVLHARALQVAREAESSWRSAQDMDNVAYQVWRERAAGQARISLPD